MKPFKSNTRYIRFQPQFLHKIEQTLKDNQLLSDNPDWANLWLFLCEFNLSGEKVTFDFKIGKGDDEARKKLYNIYKNNERIFNKVNARKNLSPEWHLALQIQILSKDEYQKCMESGDLQILTTKFEEVEKVLTSIEETIIIACREGKPS
jgi:hypothetical protein